MLSQTKIENCMSISTHTIVFVVHAHSILKLLSVDFCASFKQTNSVNATLFLKSWNGQKMKKCWSSWLQLNSCLQPSGLTYLCHLGNQSIR